MIDSNSSKIYKILPYKIGFDSRYGAMYVEGYSKISEFDDSCKMAFCKNIGYWIPYECIEETDLQTLPKDYCKEYFADVV